MKYLFSVLTVAMLLTSSMISNAQSSAANVDSATSKPNILFIIMDDVGIDQMKIFGYGGLTPPKMPNVNCGRARRSAIPEHLVDAGVFAQPRHVF